MIELLPKPREFNSNTDQLADIFTKPLVLEKFFNMQSSLYVVDAALDSWGHINSDNKGKIQEVPYHPT